MTAGTGSEPPVPDAQPSDDAELLALQADYPSFRIWREDAFDRARYVSRSLRPGQNPHTVITDDPAELRAALARPTTLAEPAGG